MCFFAYPCITRMHVVPTTIFLIDRFELVAHVILFLHMFHKTTSVDKDYCRPSFHRPCALLSLRRAEALEIIMCNTITQSYVML